MEIYIKRLLIIWIFGFCRLAIFSQETIPESEVILLTRGASSSNQQTVFEINPLVYESVIDNAPVSFLTTTYSYMSTFGCKVGVRSSGTNVKLKGNVSCANSGLEYIFLNETWEGGPSCSGNAEYRPFANALYEVKIKVDNIENFKFLLDTRHNSLPNGCDNNCSGNDISIVYFINTNTVGAIGGYWTGRGELKNIYYGHYYTWWELRENNCSVALSIFNEEYMPILLEPVNQNYHPYIQWTKANNSQAQERFQLYDLQRSINNGPFSSIFQTDNFNTTSYLDYGVYWVPNQYAVTVLYRITAIYDSPFIVDMSNYQKISTVDQWLWKSSSSKINQEYLVSQNYPNPFNSFTRILYQIQSGGFVNLVIYDVLGRELRSLVNEFKEQGEYFVDFDGVTFNSGLYIYTIKLNNYTVTKQMLLLK